MATKIMTAYGNAQIDTAQKVFGTASGFFGGTGWIDTPDSEDFNFGNGNFTIDFWLRRSATGYQQLLGQAGPEISAHSVASLNMRLNTDNTLGFYVYSGNNPHGTNTSYVISDTTTWHHIALVRNGGALTLYGNGEAQHTEDVTGVTINNSPYKFAIGRTGEYTLTPFVGWIDEFRLSMGIARWTEDFTPPTGPHTADAYTVLLLHMDGTDGSTSFIDDSESTLANAKANIGGAWKQAVDGHVKVDGIWKPISAIHTKIDGVWKQA